MDVGDGALDAVEAGVGGWVAPRVGVLESIGSGVGVGVSAVVGVGVSAAPDMGVADAGAATEGSAVSEPHEATTTASSEAARTKTAPTEIFTCGPSEDGGPGVGGHGVLPCRNPPPLGSFAQRGGGTPREREKGRRGGRPQGAPLRGKARRRSVVLESFPVRKRRPHPRSPGPRRTRHRRDKAERAPGSGPRRRRGRRQAILGPEPRDGPGAAHGDLEHRRRRNLLWTPRLPRPRHADVHPRGGWSTRSGGGVSPERPSMPSRCSAATARKAGSR